MVSGYEYAAKQKIHFYDGYLGDPIWVKETNYPYYSYKQDKQFSVPIRSIDEIKAELGIE